MTPALERCLAAYRRLCEELGRAPMVCELARALDGIRDESVQRAIEKLTIQGYDLPMSRMKGRGWRPAIEVKPKPAPAAAREAQAFITLLREADVLVSRYGHPEDSQWSEWRSKAAVYLNGEKS